MSARKAAGPLSQGSKCNEDSKLQETFQNEESSTFENQLKFHE
jgi:hypothetical protein